MCSLATAPAPPAQSTAILHLHTPSPRDTHCRVPDKVSRGVPSVRRLRARSSISQHRLWAWNPICGPLFTRGAMELLDLYLPIETRDRFHCMHTRKCVFEGTLPDEWTDRASPWALSRLCFHPFAWGVVGAVRLFGCAPNSIATNHALLQRSAATLATLCLLPVCKRYTELHIVSAHSRCSMAAPRSSRRTAVIDTIHPFCFLSRGKIAIFFCFCERPENRPPGILHNTL